MSPFLNLERGFFMTKTLNNLLLVSGSGRNVGKTTFLTRLISVNAGKPIVAVKITPHFHEPTDGLNLLQITPEFRIYEETTRTATKDSSLFLQAGASRVFYIQATDEFLLPAFEFVESYIAADDAVVVESAALRKWIVPGLYIFIRKKYEKVKPSARVMIRFADRCVISDGETFSLSPDHIRFEKNWQIVVL